MKFEQWKQVTKVVLLVGVFICVIAQFLPWSEISVPFAGKINFYCGGLFFSGFTTTASESFEFYLTRPH